MQEALEKRYEPDAVCVSVICTEAGYSEEKPVYFSNFEEAYSYLNEQHAEYMQPFSAEIHRIPLENAKTQLNTSITGIPNMCCTICSFGNAHRVWI